MAGEITKIIVPKWGMTMTEATLVAWLVEEGDEVRAGDPVVEVETEKVTNVIESPVEGALLRIVAQVNDVLPIGGLLGVVGDPAVPVAEVDAVVADFRASFVAGAD